eukprot:scaffold130003_cov37-Prasinocladus_malaysianus.AAC.1
MFRRGHSRVMILKYYAAVRRPLGLIDTVIMHLYCDKHIVINAANVSYMYQASAGRPDDWRYYPTIVTRYTLIYVCMHRYTRGAYLSLLLPHLHQSSGTHGSRATYRHILMLYTSLRARQQSSQRLPLCKLNVNMATMTTIYIVPTGCVWGLAA